MQRLTPPTFALNDDNLLWLALTGRNTGQRPSGLIGIEDDVAALDLDLACTLRLMRWDNERRKEDFEALAVMLGGTPKEESEGFTEVW